MKKLTPYKTLIQVTTLMFALTFCVMGFSQTNKGDKRIKIHTEVDGKTVEIDTIIPAGAEFDYKAFMKENGLEGSMNFNEDGISIDIEGDHEDMIRKEVRIEEDEVNGDKTVTKTIIYKDEKSAESEVEMIRSTNEEGEIDVKILIDGKEVEGEKKVVRKKKRGNKNYEIEEEIETEDGKKIIIIEKEVEKKK